MSQPIRLGISTCPNDTFAFHALLTESIDLDGFAFTTELLDVEELNEGMASGAFDVAKMSYHAMLHQAANLRLLSAGSALGFGVGPVVLSRAGYERDRPEVPVVLTPGRWTTASLLWQLFHGGEPCAAGAGRRRFEQHSTLSPQVRRAACWSS